MENEAPAIFEGPTGSLRISVEGYQFPKITDDDWDSNWLIVNGDAVLDGKLWTFRDPCLTNFEIKRLADWLDQVACGKVEKAFCGFTEPNLEFEQVSDAAIRIAFSLETLPPWSKRNDDLGEIGFNVPINDRLCLAASSLRAILRHFPIRAREGS